MKDGVMILLRMMMFGVSDSNGGVVNCNSDAFDGDCNDENNGYIFDIFLICITYAHTPHPTPALRTPM